MPDLKDRLERELEKLKTTRDELRVQMALGKKEAQDAFEEVSEQWNHLEAQIARLKKEGEAALDDIGDAAELLVEEIKRGFDRVRSLL